MPKAPGRCGWDDRLVRQGSSETSDGPFSFRRVHSYKPRDCSCRRAAVRAAKRPGGVDRALGEPTHGGDGSVSGRLITTSILPISATSAREILQKNGDLLATPSCQASTVAREASAAGLSGVPGARWRLAYNERKIPRASVLTYGPA